MKQRFRSKGVTILEVIVAILVILILLALLIPAVNDSHGGDHSRIRCLNNIRNLGLAETFFSEVNDGSYPSYAIELGSKEVSWVGALFPHLEQRPLYEIWNDSSVMSKPEPFLDLLYCPSNYIKDIQSKNVPALSYLVNTKVCTISNKVNYGLNDYNIRDGLHQTLLFAEDRLDRVEGGRRWTMTAEKEVGFRADDGTWESPGKPVQVSDELSSMHVDGMINVCFCDGGAKCMSKETSKKVYQLLVGPDDGCVVECEQLELPYSKYNR